MIKKLLKKLVGIKQDDEQSKMAVAFQEKTNKFQKFLAEKSDLIHQEYEVVTKKLENLRETNYAQGLKYLERGDVRDAIFRFRIVRKFWPDLLDAHYQLAYALMLNKKPRKAKIILEHLIESHPEYDPKARDLLERINNSSSNAS